LGQNFLLREDEFSTLSVTDDGKRLLLGEASPVLAKPLVAKKKKESRKKAVQRREEEWEDIDQDLFQVLRKKRTELAGKKGVPAYIIFSDRTLRDIAAKKPVTKDDFADVYGVGKNKLRSYADMFIEVVKEYSSPQ
jgi:ATP-dependent DNA helicase RecQ